MATRLAEAAGGHPRRLALIALVVFLLVAVLGGPAPGGFDVSRAFDDPGSESTGARERIEDASGKSAEPGVVAVVEGGPGGAKVTEVARAIEAEPGIEDVTWPAPGSPLVSEDGRRSLVVADVETTASETDVAESLIARFSDDPAVELGGNAVAGAQVGEQATTDLARAELIAFPLLVILTFLLFRGVAALLLWRSGRRRSSAPSRSCAESTCRSRSRLSPSTW